MTTRPFSVVRRRANLVDIIIPRNPAVEGYRLRAAANFDAAFSDLITASISAGYLGSTINRNVLTPLNSRDHVRIVFDPDQESLTDTDAIWLKFQPIDFAGAPGAESLPILILPEEAHQLDGKFAIRGNAPSGASVADSLEIGLPRRVSDVKVTNNDAADELLIAFTTGGAEQQILATETFDLGTYGAVERLLVRGDSAVVNFSATFTSYLPL